MTCQKLRVNFVKQIKIHISAVICAISNANEAAWTIHIRSRTSQQATNGTSRSTWTPKWSSRTSKTIYERTSRWSSRSPKTWHTKQSNAKTNGSTYIETPGSTRSSRTTRSFRTTGSTRSTGSTGST